MRRIAKKTNMIQREWQFKNLINIFTGAKGKKEIEALLQILLSPSEKNAIAQRADIIRLLKAGEKYYEIEGKFGISSNTIASTAERYHKYGTYNADFNSVYKKYKIEPAIEMKPVSRSTDRSGGIGAKSAQVGREKLRKKIALAANKKAIEDAKTRRR
jgi:Trp operon repressor